MKMKMEIKQFNIVVALTLVSSLILQSWISLAPLFSSGLLNWMLVLSVPSVLALACTPVLRRLMWDALKSTSIARLGFGVLAGLLLISGEQAVLYLWKLGTLNTDLYTTSGELTQVAGPRLLLGNEFQSMDILIGNLSLSMAISGSLFGVVLFTLFELLWRSGINQELASILGPHRAPIFTGVLMGLCFIPFSLTGVIPSSSPYLSAFVYVPLLCVGLSFVLAGINGNESNVWPGILALGIYGLSIDKMPLVPSSPDAALLAKGILMIICILWVRMRLTERHQHQQQEQLSESN